MTKLNHLTGIFMLFLWVNTGAQNTDHQVFYNHSGNNKQWITFNNNHDALYRIITDEAFRLLDERAALVDELTTTDDWKSYQSEVKASLCQSLKKFVKCPLNALVTGKIERESYTVEKVLFESQPGFYVTAGLFIPKEKQQPAPAVIYCSGHSELGFRSDTYQHVILNLVEKGFIVFAFDPLGQGERLQYADSTTGKSAVGGPTTEHSYAGIQTLITGTSLTDYFIWDGIRAADFLETRPEVDMKRLGITGRSGGGTQAAMIAACDDRIFAVAPENYITSFKRLLQSIGPQDAEQNPWQAIAKGIDHPDFLHIHAPKPALILTTTHDFFSIQGARETFTEAGRSYSAFGKPDNLQMVEDDGGHQSTRNNRESMYAFFQKHLNLPGENKDETVTPFSPEELMVTPTGQVSTSYPSETIFTLNRKINSLNNTSATYTASHLAMNAEISFNRNLTAFVYTGKFNHKNILAEKYFIEHDKKDYALPLYVLRNETSNNNKTIIWLHPNGKSVLLDEPLAEELMEAGFTIVTADLPGSGELKNPDFKGDGVISGITFNYTFGASLIGKSITGIQTEAIDLLMQFIYQHPDLLPSDKYILGSGTAALPVLYFTCLKSKFRKVAFLDFPESISSLVETEYYNPETAWSAVPGSLPGYDLQNLVEMLSESGTEIFIQDKPDNKGSKSHGPGGNLIKFFSN